MTEEFKVLNDREHVLHRPGVYLGSVVSEQQAGIINYQYQTATIVPALMKMIEEVTQNSIDEHIRTDGQFATEIKLSIVSDTNGTEITVQDNGRGIPQHDVNGKPRPVLAWTELRAGSNFDDSKRITAGTNGMGAALTNIFSTSFKGETSDAVNKLVLTCADNMQSIKWKVSPGGTRGTKVTFVPDLKRFGLTEFTQDHIDVLRDRLINLAISYPTITFKFNGEKIHFKNIKQVAKQFHADAVSIENNDFGLIFAPSGAEEEFRCLTYVNGIYVKNGGSHVDFVLNKISDNLRAHIKKKHKIDVLPNQVKQHLLIGAWCRNFKALKFDSQTKERITNTAGEVAAYFGDIDLDKVSKQILNTASIIDPMIAAILYKKEMAEKLALAKKQKGAAKVRVVNHIAATDPNFENKMLLLCEGLSAIGTLISVRDPKRIGGYPLRGKPLNVRGMKPLDIIKNKEIFELMAVIGLELGKPVENLNYGKIAVFSDADVDGQHIFALLLNLFSLWPELFEQKRIYRMMSPLYYCTKGKDTKVFYTKEEFDSANLKGYATDYFKGLGSMPENVYHQCVNNPRLIRVDADDLQKLEMAFGDSADLRKTWLLA